MTPRLSGHFSKFGLVFFVLNSLLGIARQKSLEKITIILALKPQSHVRILIYRTWAIGSYIRLRISKIRSKRARRRRSGCSITKASKGEKSKLRSGIERLIIKLGQYGGFVCFDLL